MWAAAEEFLTLTAAVWFSSTYTTVPNSVQKCSDLCNKSALNDPHLDVLGFFWSELYDEMTSFRVIYVYVLIKRISGHYIKTLLTSSKCSAAHFTDTKMKLIVSDGVCTLLFTASHCPWIWDLIYMLCSLHWLSGRKQICTARLMAVFALCRKSSVWEQVQVQSESTLALWVKLFMSKLHTGVSAVWNNPEQLVELWRKYTFVWYLVSILINKWENQRCLIV